MYAAFVPLCRYTKWHYANRMCSLFKWNSWKILFNIDQENRTRLIYINKHILTGVIANFYSLDSWNIEFTFAFATTTFSICLIFMRVCSFVRSYLPCYTNYFHVISFYHWISMVHFSCIIIVYIFKHFRRFDFHLHVVFQESIAMPCCSRKFKFSKFCI